MRAKLPADAPFVAKPGSGVNGPSPWFWGISGTSESLCALIRHHSWIASANVPQAQTRP